MRLLRPPKTLHCPSKLYSPLILPTLCALQLTICEAGLSDVNKLVCWSQPTAVSAQCMGSAGACDFAYTVTDTPQVMSVSPMAGQGGLPITITGMRLGSGITGVELKDAYGSVRQCSSVAYAGTDVVTCTLPPLPPGPHSITLVRDNGERSVVGQQHLMHNGGGAATAMYFSQPYLPALSGNVGSLAGGNVLTLTTNASVDGLTTGFDDVHEVGHQKQA